MYTGGQSSYLGSGAPAGDSRAFVINPPSQETKKKMRYGNGDDPTPCAVMCEWFKVGLLALVVITVATLVYAFYYHIHIVHDDIYSKEVKARHRATDLLTHYCDIKGSDGGASDRHVNKGVCEQAEMLLSTSFELNVMHGVAHELVEHIPFVGHCLVGNPWCMVGYMYYMEFVRGSMLYIVLVLIAIVALAYIFFVYRKTKHAVQSTRNCIAGPMLPTTAANAETPHNTSALSHMADFGIGTGIHDMVRQAYEDLQKQKTI
jgi:uncharacterized membrane protein